MVGQKNICCSENYCQGQLAGQRSVQAIFAFALFGGFSLEFCYFDWNKQTILKKKKKNVDGLLRLFSIRTIKRKGNFFVEDKEQKQPEIYIIFLRRSTFAVK